MFKEKIILVGGGGHCKACIDVIEEEARFNIKGIVDLPDKIGQTILGYPIIGSDDELEEIVTKNRNFLITIGYIKTPDVRINLFNLIKKLGGNFPVIISPKAHVSKYSQIEEGSIIMHGAIVNSLARIGKNCIINNNALIEHDASIGDFCHISSGAIINGGTFIRGRNFIGSNTIVNQGIKINSRILIGSGSVVRKDIEESGVYVGNPLIRIK